MTVKNYELLPAETVKGVLKRSGLKVDPKFMCKLDKDEAQLLFREFGVDFDLKLEENGCLATAKVKKVNPPY